MRSARRGELAVRLASLMVALGAMLLGPPARGDSEAAVARPADAAAAFEMVRDESPDDAALARASALLDEAAAREPRDARWVMGRALVEFHRENGAECVELCERAIALEPGNADWHYRLGTALFALRINEVGLLSKGTVASKGKAAYEKAAALDPNHLESRIGLAMFYANAPGVAGGSEKKAREIAESMLQIPGGGYRGSLLLASLAAKDKKWDEMNRRYADAAGFATTDAERAGMSREHALVLLQQKKDPSAALALARTVPMTGESADSFTWYVVAMCEQDLGNMPAAVEAYGKVLEINPDAQNSRANLGACLEKTGDLEGALAAYEEYLARFPEGQRSEDVKKGAKRVRKELDKRAKQK